MSIILDEEERELRAKMAVCRRSISEDQMRKFENYAAEIFAAFGLDLNDPAVRETPKRFITALAEVTSGFEGDPKLIKIFETECRGGSDCRLAQTVEGPIQFFSLCEHHALPFHGNAYVGYIAHEHILGISKLTRLVRMFANRFTLQERIGRQIADALEAMLKPHGVAVYLEAFHLCTQMRGVREVSPRAHTTYWRGEYDNNPSLRAEFLEVCKLQRA